MDKKEYFELSTSLKVTPRCPILNLCQRRAMTIYFFSYSDLKKGSNFEIVLGNAGELSSEYAKNKIEVQGESPTIIKGGTSMYFSNMCPEICLFESAHSPMGFSSACTSGDWDKYRTNNQNRIIEEGHFTQCPEYSRYTFDKKRKIEKKRTAIPNISKVRAELQQEINSSCPFCNGKAVGHFQIHHIDEDPTNHKFENLLLLCPTCHSKITKGDITSQEVFDMKSKIAKATSPL
ncbi:HNH endonuclease signature motif containing protein [Pedobacter sp. MW01-1-1]|uniref:HNH endonuclease signature motif containing protein n=1 Tax=Pedobacter sp. MW01-1-1 TaxID=3383027 RepID=UPI003FF131A0